MDKPHILIVDDDLALLQALPQALYLRIDGIKVDTSDEARSAIEQIGEREYYAIVSDIKMPGMDGLALLAKVQELRPDTPAALHRAIQTYQLRREVKVQRLALELHARSLERMVQERTNQLVEANAAKDKFLSIVSHELKTPLTSLKGMTQLFRRQVERAEAPEIVSIGLSDMERSIRRMEVLVNDLLDSSLIETNMFVLHRKRCDLVELCRHLLDEYTAGGGPALTFEIPGDPIEVEVDADRMSQVIINLLSNARKYSPKGSPITVTLQQAGYEASVSVRDMGVGIPPSLLPNIFEQFYRVPGVEVQNGPHIGLGLGLYISRKIVERHGGHIDVQSVPGQGSIFSVVLPLFVDPDADTTDAAKLTRHTQAIWTIAH